MADRMGRISEEFKKELSDIIQKELKDPRLPQMVSVTLVEVTKDLKHAKVYISVFGSDEEHKNAMIALKSASGFLRKEIGSRINLRNTPELHFVIDDSIEQSIYISKLIDDTLK
ncbi:MAG TPA: 30S ribosome-binding factor RbfA [Clostridia bacterium]|jgi:ribosome-binding factor A|nr:30S ribosome-binding factor RbfA [Clostridia bacterium]